MSRRLFATATAVGSLIFAAACGSPATQTGGGSSAGTTKVTVGVIPIVDVAPLYLGKQKGFFSSRGIDLNPVLAQGGAAIVPAVLSGQYQFGFSNITSLLIAKDKGLDLKITGPGDSSTGKEGADFGAVVVPGDSPIKSPKDLAGKTVAVNTLKNIGDTTVRASVRKAGGDADKVKFVELGFPDMPAALTGKKVDAAWVVEPFLSVSKSQGARVVAWNFVDSAPNLPIAAYFTSAKTVADTALVTKFTEAMNESLAYAQAHPDEARAVIPTYTKITADQVKAITLPQWPTAIDRPALQTLADLAVKDGLVSKAPDLSSLLP